MKSSRHIWILFTPCLAVVLTAMGWISLTALRAEAEAQRQRAEATRQAAWEENVRLALWRMDSTLAPLVAQESARPFFVYRSFLPVNRTYSGMLNDRREGEILIPSPLLGEVSPNIVIHFQFEPDGQLTSPQIPTKSNRKLAIPNHVSEEAVRQTESELTRVASLVDRDRLASMLPERTPEPVEVVVSPLAQNSMQRLAQQKQRRADLQSRGRGAVEFNERNLALRQSAEAMVQNYVLNTLGGTSLPSTDVGGVLMTPLWIDGSLILARRIVSGGREYVQGCLLDWSAIRESLLEAVEDLLPAAELEPVAAAPAEEEARMLAALPVRLIPGPAVVQPGSVEREARLSPIVLSLGIAWGCVLLAAAAVGVLLLGVIRLSERRASFVTAVTHELRTPLTTFQMYAEMLAEGMVSDEQQQRQYLDTLRTESARLTHLVENVLAYARLERGRGDGRLETVEPDRLIEPMLDRLASRAGQAGMELVVERDTGSDGTAVRANSSAVDQVLFNLVDNAGKYASAASDKRIHLVLQSSGNGVQVMVRDHGPGVSPSARRRLFQAFSKSAQEAAHTAPGVGLGLALSRRLARDMGGDLHLDESVTEGACFVLTLPTTADSIDG